MISKQICSSSKLIFELFLVQSILLNCCLEMNVHRTQFNLVEVNGNIQVVSEPKQNLLTFQTLRIYHLIFVRNLVLKN